MYDNISYLLASKLIAFLEENLNGWSDMTQWLFFSSNLELIKQLKNSQNHNIKQFICWIYINLKKNHFKCDAFWQKCIVNGDV